MPLSREELLLEEYKTCLELRKHEDGRKANLHSTFFLIEGGLFAFYNWLGPNERPTAILLSILAVLFCLFWLLMMQRMRIFIKASSFQTFRMVKSWAELSPLR
jgi:hypothetical protein